MYCSENRLIRAGRYTGEVDALIIGLAKNRHDKDGKLIGAVTHVFVNDPTRGYAIFAENMINNISDKTDAMSA